MVAPLFLTLIENAINRYLKLDSGMKENLDKFSGRIIRLTITGIELTFFFKFEKKEIRLLESYNGPIDASLTGSPITLMRSWMNSLQGRSELPKDIIITGDPNLIQTLNGILQQCDINWEKQLAQFTGDTVAHKLSEFLGGLGACLSQTDKVVSDKVGECLHDKRALLPEQSAVDLFCRDVDRLRDDVERAAVRFNAIIKTL